MAASEMGCSEICCTCLFWNRDVYDISTSNKSATTKKYFPDNEITSICRNCWRKIENFDAFRSSAVANMKKRFITPEKSRTPKRRMTTTPKRIPVVQELIASVEKLKRLQLQPESSIDSDLTALQEVNNVHSLTTEHQYSVSSDKIVKSNFGAMKPKKVLFATSHHSYADSTHDVGKVCATSDTHEDVKKEVINDTAKAVSVLSAGNTSVLSTKSMKSLSEETLFSQAALELSLNIPFLYDLLMALVGGTGNKKATVAMIYSMILNSRNRKVSAIQKQLTVLAIKCHADNQMLSRLNKIHVTMSAESKRNVMTDMAEQCEEQIVSSIASGADGKLNGDNLDIFVHTNDVRMENKSRDYHFFATDWTPFRLTNDDFENHTWLKEHVTEQCTLDKTVNLETFLPNLGQFTHDIKVLAARVLIRHIPHFQWMNLVVPDHIHHPLEDIMTRKTTSYCLPILLKNEMKHSDCIQIMDSYEEQMSTWYRRAGRGDDFSCLQIPIGGDQLTRVRLDTARALRMGAHRSEERFENLFPVIIEMFHTQMDFLEKTVKKFMKNCTGRDSGTLSNIKILVQRTSVNGNVKSRFKAHDEFVQLCGDAYVLEAAMEYFGMEELSSPPTQHELPININKSHLERRKAVFEETMDGFLQTIQGPLSIDKTSPEMVNLLVAGQVVTLPMKDKKVTLILKHEGTTITAHIPLQTLKNKDLQIPVHNITVDVKLLQTDDELNNYIRNFLQYYFILSNFKDAIYEGDIFRVSNMLKFMIPVFYRHSKLSKYLVECVDYILKTELELPTKLALQVRVASYVNPKGMKGKNKAADMQKENQVKDLKDLIKGLGANKTEELIVKISKAKPLINTIVYNLDMDLNYKDVKTTHKARNQEEDLKYVLKKLRTLRPFSRQHGRKLTGYPGMLSSVFIELKQCDNELRETIMQTAIRLSSGLPVHAEDIDDQMPDIDHEEIVEFCG